MKILKIPELAPTKFVCRACGCVYEAEYGEYTLFCDGLVRTYSGTTKCCKCPICNEMNYVHEEVK